MIHRDKSWLWYIMIVIYHVIVWYYLVFCDISWWLSVEDNVVIFLSNKTRRSNWCWEIPTIYRIKKHALAHHANSISFSSFWCDSSSFIVFSAIDIDTQYLWSDVSSILQATTSTSLWLCGIVPREPLVHTFLGLPCIRSQILLSMKTHRHSRLFLLKEKRTDYMTRLTSLLLSSGSKSRRMVLILLTLDWHQGRCLGNKC